MTTYAEIDATYDESAQSSDPTYNAKWAIAVTEESYRESPTPTQAHYLALLHQWLSLFWQGRAA